MLKFVSYDILFQEVPDEVSLALSISGCPNRCPGCHSVHLMEDMGAELSRENLRSLVERYRGSVTCVCFMGGDAEREEIEMLAEFVHSEFGLKSAWYSGREVLPHSLDSFDYIKLGDYREELGGLNSRTTNQRMYRVSHGEMEDITDRFWR